MILVLKFYALLTTYPHLSWVPMTLNVADRAAKLRADHGLKTPDAIQAASAISAAPPELCAMTGLSARCRQLKALFLMICAKRRGRSLVFHFRLSSRIEAPCSKLQGIFDPQGSNTYSNRSLTPQQATGMRSLLDSTRFRPHATHFRHNL